MSKRRFELIEGTSSKFWEIEEAGTELLIAWGKIGTAGQSQTKSFASESKAQEAAAKLVKEKTAKGYAEVETDSPPKPAKAEPAKAEPAKAEPAKGAPAKGAPKSEAAAPSSPASEATSQASTATDASSAIPPHATKARPTSRPSFDARALYASIRKAVVKQKLSDYPHLGPVLSAFASPELPAAFDLGALTFLDYGYYDEKTQKHTDVLPWAFELAFALGGPSGTIDVFFSRWARDEASGDFWPHIEPSFLALLPEEDLAALHAIGRERMVGKSLRQRMAIAFLFEDLPLISALVPEMLQSSFAAWSILVGVHLRDLEVLDRLVAHFRPKYGRDLARALSHPDVLAVLGPAAGRYYSLRFEEEPNKHLVNEAAAAASPEAARFFAAHLDHKLVTKTASKFFTDHKELGRAALLPVALGKSKAAGLAGALALQLGLETKPAAAPATAVELAEASELPEWLRTPRWLTQKPEPKKAPEKKKEKKDKETSAVAVAPVRVPFVMEEAMRKASLTISSLYEQRIAAPAVLLGEVSSLPVSAAARKRFGSRPYWFFSTDHADQSTLFDTHPEPDVSGPEVDEIMSFLTEQSGDSSYVLQSHIGSTSSIDFGFHSGIDVARAAQSFEADGFRVLRQTAWPLPNAASAVPQQVVRPQGDARFVEVLTNPRNRVFRGWVTDIVERSDGSSTHTTVGTLSAIFDTMSDDAVIRVLPLLPAGSGDVATAQYLAARFGDDEARQDAALAGAARLGRSEGLLALAEAGVASTALATPYAKLLLGKRAPTFAKRWLAKHLAHAVAGLVPAALRGSDVDAGLAGLRMLAATHRDEVLRLSSLHGKEATEAIEEALSRDAFDDVPKKIPALPPFAHPSLHPPLLLRASGHALPESAVVSLLTMLAFSRAESPYAGVLAARELLEPRSADAFAWSLFSQWEAGGRDGNDWVLLSVGHLGGDECARKLTPKIRAWPGESAHAAAVKGLDALATIGSDIALMYLHGIAQKLKFKGLQEKARQKIDEIAEARGLSAAELSDRLVPDLNLDADGSRVLDFGARSFRVIFDETLKPHLKDGSGKVLSDLPKPGKADDAAKAKEATEIWKGLKADSKAIAQQEVLRLEQIMCMQRRIDPQAFATFFVEHPLVIHLTKRLIWGAYRDGTLLSCFRVAEDRSYADADDAAYTVPEGATVGLVHRLELPPEAGAKLGQILGDYELLQPFDQLSRATYTVTDAEKSGSSITRPTFKAKLGKLLGLENRGWRKGPAEDAGWVWRMEKALPGGIIVELPLGTGANDGGICMGWMEGTPTEQAITGFTLRGVRDHRPEKIESVSPVLMSELLRDIELLRE